MDEVTLRDYFAARALQALIRNEPDDWNSDDISDIEEHRQHLAFEAYRMANAMMDARTYTLKGSN